MTSMDPLSPQAEPAPADKISRKRVWLRRALELLLVIAVFMGVRAWQQRDIVSGKAPALHGELLDQRPFVMPAKPGKPVLVQFWATWCAICRTEQGTIEKLAGENLAGQKLAGENQVDARFGVVTVAMQSGTHESLCRFMAEQKLSFPVLNDPEGLVAATWGVHAVPASFIIDSSGQVRFVEIGYTTEIGLRLRLWLAQYL